MCLWRERETGAGVNTGDNAELMKQVADLRAGLNEVIHILQSAAGHLDRLTPDATAKEIAAALKFAGGEMARLRIRFFK